MTAKTIREDLRNIRYYYSRKDLFEKSASTVGVSAICEMANKYNQAICSAPPRLYDLYVCLYLQNNTQESLSNKLGFSVEYISILNAKLIKFFQKNLEIKEAN